MPNVGRKKGKTKNHAGKNNGPSRERYWRNGILEKRKVKNLMKYNGMTRQQAGIYWRENRKGRIKTRSAV